MYKNNLIKRIFIISLAIAVIIPVTNIYFLFPLFTNLLVEHSEDESRRVGSHLSKMLLVDNKKLTYKSVSDQLSLNKYQELLEDFQLMKLKIFNSSGETLYSTDTEDIGKTNENEYFHQVVARGNIYSKVVEKNARTLEGQTVTVDVVESYVPIMVNNQFMGAFEIYYDVSTRNRKLHDFILLSSIVTILLMFGYLATLVFTVLSSEKRKAEDDETGLPSRYTSPFYLMIVVTISIFLAEMCIMAFVSTLPPVSSFMEALFDSSLLVMFLSPIIYFFMLRPLLVHIAELRQAKEHISHLSLYDKLTNLPNRTLFEDRLKQAILQAERYDRKAAVLFIDLDNFKRINDTFEHRAGDRILKDVSERLISQLRSSDSISRQIVNDEATTIARIGGDEFTILLTEVNSIQEVARIAERVQNLMSVPFMINSQELFISASIGIALYPADGKDVDSLLRNAHSATYHVKNYGRNNFQFYAESMNNSAFNRLILENDLRKALENDEFLLHFQPRVDNRTGRVESMEALIRWNSPERGMVPPMEFIPLAEECGLIIPLGEWVLRTACEIRKTWPGTGMDGVCVSVNISGHEFQKSNFISGVSSILQQTGLDPTLLEIEITESIMMQQGEDALATLHQLKEMGIKLAMDDFGTGYSSFGYLRRFPLDILKIDKSFIKDVTTNKDTDAIVEAIIAMSNRLQLTTVAEGVETEEQLQFLRVHGCDQIQGYLISRPLPAEQLAEFIQINLERVRVKHNTSPLNYQSSGDENYPDPS